MHSLLTNPLGPLSSYRDWDIFRTLPNIKMERFAKRIVLECRRVTRSFQGWRGFVELWHSEKHKQRTRQLHNYVSRKKLNPKMDKIRAFFSQNQIIFFDFQKKSVETCPKSPSCVNVNEYASISLNIPEYPWKCLHNVLTMPGLWGYLVILHFRQAFEDASGFKCLRVLNMARLCMQGLHIILNMSEYGSIYIKNVMSQYILMSLSMP